MIPKSFGPMPSSPCPLPSASLAARSSGDKQLAYRAFPVRADGPDSLDMETRSVEVVGATEEPVEIFDPERWEVVKEVLLMDGCEIPRSRQVTLQDTHQRGTTASVLGSYRDMKVVRDQLVGRAHFSTVAEAESPWIKVREGHITDFSIGYRQIESAWIPEGESAVVRGRTFKGPLRVTSRWRPKELSVVPIGADELAKARAAAEPPKPTQPETPPTQTTPTEEKKMSKRLRQILISRGMPETATDEEAWSFFDKIADQLGPAPAAAPPAEDQARAERERIVEIEAMGRTFEVERSVLDKLVTDGTALDLARKQILDIVAQRQVQTPPAVSIVADERDKFRAAAEDSLLLRSSIQATRPKTPAPGSQDLAGWTLVELARHSLRLAGQPTGGNRMEMVGRAMVASDFPKLLANVANKTLMASYDAASETWQVWCGTGQVSDFKTHSMPRASETDDLDQVPEHGEYKYGQRSEAQEQYSIATYGKLFAITRQAIINDDLSALTDIPARHAEAAARKIGDVAYAVLTANAAMGDGIALFDVSTHKNYVTSGGAPGVATIAAGILAMGIQKDILGKRRLNIRPQFFLAPKALEGAAEVFFRSNQFSDHNTVATDSSFASTRVNPYSGDYFTRVYEPRLDDADATGWYLAGPKGKTVNVFFLDGIQAPYLETRQGWTVDGVEYKVRIDCGAKALDWRALYFNDGE